MSAPYSKLVDELVGGIVDGSKDRWIANGTYQATHEQMQTALLRDIAISLRAIRATLDCQNTVDIPNILRDIRRNTTKPRKRKVVKKRGTKR